MKVFEEVTEVVSTFTQTLKGQVIHNQGVMDPKTIYAECTVHRYKGVPHGTPYC